MRASNLATLGEMLVGADSQERALPRGPHDLSREAVRESQNERLLWAIAEAVADKGFIATTVADVISRAKVSRTTFYQLYDDKLECFLAANRLASGILLGYLKTHLEHIDAQTDLSPRQRFELLLDSYLDTVTELSEFSKVFLVEVYAAGAPAVAQRRELLVDFVDLVTASRWGIDEGNLTETQLDAIAQVMVSAVSLHATNAIAVNDLASIKSIKASAFITIGMLMREDS